MLPDCSYVQIYLVHTQFEATKVRWPIAANLHLDFFLFLG